MRPETAWILVLAFAVAVPAALADDDTPTATASVATAPEQGEAVAAEQPAPAASPAPEVAADARAIGALFGALELTTWRIVGAGGDDPDKVSAAVEKAMAERRGAVKSAIAAATTVRCQTDSTGGHPSLRMRTPEAMVAYREGFAEASGDLAAVKKKATGADATRALAAKLVNQERAFRAQICREVLTESGHQHTRLPTVRRDLREPADS